ncbi:MAG TPA: hypothetical protein VH724_07585 [Candidatus Angelobacter sp.]|jgi:hypothetical protein|nr:hypothetical protein [Candidatus Angelobacter sp.]
MRRIVALAAFALSFVFVAQGQDNTKAMEMTGVVCNAGNVVTTDGKATCDETKGGKSSDMVFIDDQGKATKIANPKKLKGMSGKKLKMKGKMKGDMMMVDSYQPYTGG